MNSGSNLKDDGFQFGNDLDFDISPNQSSNSNSNFTNDLDFGPTSEIRLKDKPVNNNRKRSARRFLENNDAVFGGSSISTNKNTSPIANSQFQFDNRDFRNKANDDLLGGLNNYNKPISNSIMGAGDFQSRRGGAGIKAKLDDNDMMIGDSNYGINKKKSENTILFGMESRRGHK